MPMTPATGGTALCYWARHYPLLSTIWVKVLKINPEFRILRLTFHRIRHIIIASD